MGMHIGIREMRPGIWRLRVWQTDQRERYRTISGTRAEAEAAAAVWRAELEHTGPAPLTQDATLVSVIRHLLAVEGKKRSASTMRYYETILRLYIDPPPDTQWPHAPRGYSIGAKRLRRITTQHGLDFQQHLIERFTGSHNSGARSIAEAMRLCTAALDYAARLHIIPANPWTGLARVTPRKAHVTVPRTPRELAITANAGEGRTGLLLRLALASGARRGELLALTWGDFDPAESTITIRHSLTDGPDGPYLSPPKSTAGLRTVQLPEPMLAELRAERARVIEQALRTGAGYLQRPILAGADGGWWSPGAASQAAQRALRATRKRNGLTGLATSLHAMRHASATVLLSNRVSPEAVRRRLGHAKISTTLEHYAHAMVTDEPAAAAALGRMIPGKAAPTVVEVPSARAEEA